MVFTTTDATSVNVTNTANWTTWNQIYVDNATGNATSTITWSSWNLTVNNGTAATNTNSFVWRVWNTGSTSITSTGTGYAETPEQREAREQRDREYRERYARNQAELRAARDRANALLEKHLDERQKKDWKEKGWFIVDAKSGKKYRIDRGTHGNVKLLDETGRVVRGYCAQPNDVPEGDANLAQKLALEHDEEAFLRVANPRAA